jgi:hypothetical protein
VPRPHTHTRSCNDSGKCLQQKLKSKDRKQERRVHTGNCSGGDNVTIQELEKTARGNEDGEQFFRVWLWTCGAFLPFLAERVLCYTAAQFKQTTHPIDNSPIFGLVHFVHCVSSFTVSVLTAICKRPLLLAWIARTSDMGRRRSTIVLSFCKGGSMTWT